MGSTGGQSVGSTCRQSLGSTCDIELVALVAECW